jgi:diketogulonate reductase-like aldo/keto reductase
MRIAQHIEALQPVVATLPEIGEYHGTFLAQVALRWLIENRLSAGRHVLAVVRGSR